MQTITGFHLSPQQKRLWEVQQEGASFSAQCAISIEGEIDAERLRRSLYRVVSRHEALRTNFHCLTKVKAPVQTVSDTFDLAWRVARLDGDEPFEAGIENILLREREAPFDYESRSPLRAVLLQSAERHILIVTLPGLCADAWTMNNLLQEMASFYCGEFDGPEVPAEPVQYLQFAEWQNSLLRSEDAGEPVDFWRRQDLSTLHSIKLPFEKRTGWTEPFIHRLKRLMIGRHLTAAASALARRETTSISVVLLSVWQALLWRLTGESNIVIAHIFDNRKYDELHTAMGLFARWAPVTAQLEASMRFDHLIRSNHESVQNACEWQEYYFQEADFEPDEGCDSSTFPLAFACEDRSARFNSSRTRFSLYSSYSCPDRFKLRLVCARVDGMIEAEFHYDGGVYADWEVAALARYYERLLLSATSDVSCPIGQMNMLDDAERDQLVETFNLTRCSYPQDECIHFLVEKRAEKSPGNIALLCDGAQLSYRSLNARSNRLAHLLRETGVSANDAVGLCLERSLDMVAGILAIMKAGGAYIPLDPDQPEKRLAQQLAQAEARILITQEKLLPNIGGLAEGNICIRLEDERLERQPETNPERVNSPDDLAYIIYTSGSTGVPKGVAVTHRSLTNYSDFICKRLGLDQSSDKAFHFATVSTFSADVGNTSVFPSLISGGCLHIINYETATDGARFIEYMSKRPIDVLKIVPSHLNALFSEGGAEVLPRRYLILGGESLRFELIDRIRASGARCEVINHYGPTESTVGVITMRLDDLRGRERLSSTVPIGRPIANAEAYVLDSFMNPSALGAAGELFIGGSGLALGYISQPTQTAELFVPHPFSREPGARLYRTGDIVRHLPEVGIEFLGRADHQVKIRGHRVELGEVESALLKHESIREAVVIDHTDDLTGKRLVAYLVAHRRASRDELNEFLSQYIPAYMIPAAYLYLESLPLTRNGKIDRKALPAPESLLSRQPIAYVAPRTEAEEILAEIWARALGRERVSIHDNFFELGGDSILSIQIVSRANRAGLCLKANDIFQHQTIAQLAKASRSEQTALAQQGPVTGPVPLTPIQQLFFEKHGEHPHCYNQALMLELPDEAGPALVEKSVRALVAHHDALRLRFQRAETTWRQVNEGLDDDLPFSLIDISLIPRSDQAQIIEAEASRLQSSIDISEGSIMRVVLFHLGPAGKRLLMIIHHLSVDGFSWRVLLEDLRIAYEELNRGEAVSLPPKTTSFQQWAHALTEYAKSDQARAELLCWTSLIGKGIKPLPVDHQGSANIVERARSIDTNLSDSETRALLEEVPPAYATQINDVLLTALVQTFADWTGESALVVGLEGHGREQLVANLDLSRTVGWLTCYFPVRLDLEDISQTGEALKKIKEQLRAVPNRGIGYGILRYLSEDEKAVEQLRLGEEIQVGFNYLGQLDQSISEHSLWAVARESCGPTRSQKQRRRHLIDINAGVSGRRLWMVWTYCEELHDRETIEALARAYLENLRQIIDHCRSAQAAGRTPSDFPLAGLDQRRLNAILGADRNTIDLYPLTPMQKGLLFHSLYESESRAYFVQTSCILRGDLDQTAFDRAWQQVVDRHPILRTSFSWQGLDEPLQVVHGQVRLPIERYDLRALSEDEQQQRLRALLAADRARGFDLDSATLMRLTLVQLDEQTFYLIRSNHHLILDGWSRRVIMDEVFIYYQAFSQGERIDLEPRRPFRDYIAWINEQDLSQAERFWREYLKGVKRPTIIRADRADEIQEARAETFDECRWSLSSETTARLQSQARDHHLTTNTLVQGAWAILLSHYSEGRDVTFGTVVSGRPPDIPGIESMIGLFINTLPVRVRVYPKEHLLPWLKELQEQQSIARKYDFVPLAQIQEWSEIGQGGRLFDSLLAFENYPTTEPAPESSEAAPAASSDTLSVSDVQSVNSSNYPIALVAAGETELLLSIAYDGRLYSRAVIEGMMKYLRMTLEAMAENPQRRIREISVSQARSEALSADRLEKFNFEV
ncbi:MAG: amino acid adenylation domain-containing protein [Blastocatellia bacterium]|nr:amino acid adenylation domain-containing protein [Blastocatellia bacterium]